MPGLYASWIISTLQYDLRTCESRRGIGCTVCITIVRINTPFGLTVNGVSASGLMVVTRTTWKSAITTNARVTKMTISNTPAMQRRPTHPGEMLREDFLPDYGLTVAQLAQALRVSRQSVNELLRERRALSPEMAIRLGRLFGNSAEVWLQAQCSVDLWEARQALAKELLS